MRKVFRINLYKPRRLLHTSLISLHRRIESKAARTLTSRVNNETNDRAHVRLVTVTHLPTFEIHDKQERDKR